MTLSRIALLLALSSGCASVNQEARNAGGATHAEGSRSAIVASGAFTAAETAQANRASATRNTRSRATAPLPREHEVAPLRHFYLLSPGPDAKLVVTSSDLPLH